MKQGSGKINSHAISLTPNGLDNGARFFVIGTLSNTGKSGV